MIKTTIKLPTSMDKEARFWEDSFDALWKEAKPVKVKAVQDLSKTLTVSIKPSVSKSIIKLAKERDVDPVSLIMSWIQEKTKANSQPRPAQ